MRDVKTFIYLDFIGIELYAKNKKNPNWSEFKFIGTVIDETKHTLRVKNENQSKIYIKNQYIFRSWADQPDGTRKMIEFDGNKIEGRPENRIKLIRKKNRRKLH
ncbi:MAG: ribonuclease P protein subunit [Promethearchaeota archaeon]